MDDRMKMTKLLSAACMAAFVFLGACSDSPNEPIVEPPPPPPPPPPPAIVKLVVNDSAPGFWLGDSLSLTTLITKAVNARGDTVAAPALAWSVPAGFTRTGDQVRGVREARGSLTASVGTLSAVLQATTVTDLSVKTWQFEHRCYNSNVHMRGVENPPIGLDTLFLQRFNGVLTYTVTEWKDIRARLVADRRTIRFWKDGVVDTTFGTTTMEMSQDTAASHIYLPTVENLRMISDDPRIYRSPWDPGHTTWCEAAFLGGGSDFVLKETR